MLELEKQYIIDDGWFDTEQEINACYDWLYYWTIVVGQFENNREALIKAYELYKEMSFQNS